MALSDLFMVGKVEKGEREQEQTGVAPATEKGVAVAAAAQPKGKGKGGAVAGAKAEGAFVSSKSLVSFPVASALVTILFKLLQRLLKVNEIAILYIAIVIGVLIFLIIINNKDARPTEPIGWIVAVLIGAVNSLLLAAASLGIDTAILPGP
jgi:hypothetical protein